MYPEHYYDPEDFLDALKMMVAVSDEDAKKFEALVFDYTKHELIFEPTIDYNPRLAYEKSDIFKKGVDIVSLFDIKQFLCNYFTCDFFYKYKSIIKKIVETQYHEDPFKNIVQQFHVLRNIMLYQGLEKQSKKMDYVTIVYIFDCLHT